MVVEQKPGLLAFPSKEGGSLFKEGDSLAFINEAGIPNRINEEGRVEWQILDLATINIINFADVRLYQQRRESWVVQAIFRGFNSMRRAQMGFRIPSSAGQGWPIPLMPVLSPDSVQELWHTAPGQIQSLAFKSAQEYLRHQFEGLM